MSESYKPLPEAAELWELFSYNPLTGNLHWRNGQYKEQVAGTRTTEYVQLVLKKQQYFGHRLVWAWVTGEDPGTLTIDHRDRDPRNNRHGNLRKATMEQQSHNQTAYKNNGSGYKGVCWHKSMRKWRAQIQVKGKQYRLGYFTSPEDAHQAYCAAADRLFGDFAHTGLDTLHLIK